VAPDGRSIAFVSGRDGGIDVYQMDMDGANTRRLTMTRERESLPRFLPAGELVYVVDGSDDGAVIVRHVPGAPIRLVTTREPVTALAVDRDGSRLAYVTGRPGRNRETGQRLFLQPMAGDAAATPVPGPAGEQVTMPSF
jgi:TolB protein